MMKIISGAIFFAFTFHLSSTFAIEDLSLDQALREGLQNNPQLKSMSAALDEAKWKKKETLGAYLPKIDLVATHFFDLKYQQIQVSPTSIFESTYPVTSYGAQATLNLFDGFKTTYLNSAAKSNIEAAEFELNYNLMATENSIRLKYFQALGALVLKDVAEKNVATLSEHLKRAQDLLKQGEFTKVDVLKIQVQLEQAIPEKLAAIDNAYLARKNLSEAMGVEGDERSLAETLPVPSEQLMNSGQLSTNRLDLKALEKKVLASEDSYKASRATWMPRINLIADYQNYNNRNFLITDPHNFKNAYSVGVNLVWNLFDGGSSFAKQEQNYYQKIQLEQRAYKMKLAAFNEAEFWKRRYLNSAILYEAKLRSVDASKESVRLYQNGLKAGTRTNSDLLDAELELDRSLAGVVKAQVDAVEAKLNLELAMGRRL